MDNIQDITTMSFYLWKSRLLYEDSQMWEPREAQLKSIFKIEELK